MSRRGVVIFGVQLAGYASDTQQADDGAITNVFR